MNENLSDGMLLEDNSKERNADRRQTNKSRFADILIILFSVFTAVVIFALLLGFFSFIGECTDRNNHIKSVDTVVVTGILDNTIREYSDGDRIHPVEYNYVVFLSDSLGNTEKMQIDRWAPWANASDRYDSAMVNTGDTVTLYRFGSKGFWDFNGERTVIGKNGRYYE
jgi:hypothetical protein